MLSYAVDVEPCHDEKKGFSPSSRGKLISAGLRFFRHAISLVRTRPSGCGSEIDHFSGKFSPGANRTITVGGIGSSKQSEKLHGSRSGSVFLIRFRLPFVLGGVEPFACREEPPESDSFRGLSGSTKSDVDLEIAAGGQHPESGRSEVRGTDDQADPPVALKKESFSVEPSGLWFAEIESEEVDRNSRRSRRENVLWGSNECPAVDNVDRNQ